MNKELIEKLKENFPKEPGILGRDKYFNSAILIPLIFRHGEYYLLFQKRAAHIRQGGDICFPGGGFEDEYDETFLDTALRETHEEIGIKPQDVNVIGQLDTMVAPIGAVIEIYVGVIEEEVLERDLNLNEEVEKVVLVPMSQLKEHPAKEYTLRQVVQPSYIDSEGKEQIIFPAKKLGLSERYQKPWGHKNHKVWVYKVSNEVIWGVTAVIINDLLKRY
ncbi:coenzyme A pyrophosphatase [Arcobacter sp. 31_11_sub10_T18]|nr:coenzyme A pyrophosphatase [Arcobacter sp. 31_11_sub10_T18]